MVRLFLLPFYCGLKRVFDTFNLLAEIRPKKPDYVLFHGMGWMDGTGYLLCPLVFFILCGYIDKVYLYLFTHVIKNCHQHCYGFQNLM